MSIARFSLPPTPTKGLVSGSQAELRVEHGGGSGGRGKSLPGSSQARETGIPTQITLVKAGCANCYHHKALCEYRGVERLILGWQECGKSSGRRQFINSVSVNG